MQVTKNISPAVQVVIPVLALCHLMEEHFLFLLEQNFRKFI